MDSRSRMLTGLIAIIVALSMILGVASVRRRTAVEASNRAVGMAMELDVAESLAMSEGKPISQTLQNLKANGLTHLVLTEETVATLIAEGRATISSQVSVRGESEPALTFLDLASLERVRRGLDARYGRNLRADGNKLIVGGFPPILLRQLPLGLSPEDAALARGAGLGVIGRLGNPVGTTASSIRKSLAWMAELGATSFLPSGDQTLGRRDLLPVTREALAANNVRYLSAEFAKIAGDEEMVAGAPENVIRLHTAQPAELDKIGRDGSIDRFVRAAKERGMRMLLVRPAVAASERPATDMAAFLKAIGDGLRKSNLEVGLPNPYRDPDPPKPILALLGVLAAALAACLVPIFLPPIWMRAGAWLILFGVAAVSFTNGGRQIAALLAAGVFPVAGFVLVDRLGVLRGARSQGRAILSAYAGYAVVSAVSLAGGLAVAGMLNGLPYLVKADEFRGIKIAVFVPILFVGGYFLSRLTPLKTLVTQPILWRTAVLGVGILAVILILLSRTGNDGPVGASGGELAFRGALEDILSVRPRTKEFLVGHPALLAGLAAFFVRYRRGRGRSDDPLAGWVVLLLALGAVGQTSVVNTLCHLHIPVGLSLHRVALGLVLGAIVGLPFAYLAARAFRSRAEEELVA